MQKAALLLLMKESHTAWEALLVRLGEEGMNRAGACGDWRVRDVLAHCNGWDRWQMVQLRCAFSGETPTEEELCGGIQYPPNEDMQDDAMNEMYFAGTRDLPTEEILRHWHEIADLRAGWAAAATQDQLDAPIGADWGSGSTRILRLATEVPGVDRPLPAWQIIREQIDHQDEHLRAIRQWLEG
jgi:hypothetical protein